MSVVTTPASAELPAYGPPGGGGNILTRPGWWRSLFWTIFAAVIAVAIPSLVRVSVGWPWFQYEVVSACLMILCPLGFIAGIGCFDYWAKYIVGAKLPEGHADHGAYSWRDYFKVNTDHKVIGIQYLVTTFVFFLIGGMLAEAFRAQLASPSNTYFTGDAYNGLISTHASIMIFLFIIPAFAGIANFVVPLMLGAEDMAFPRLNIALAGRKLAVAREHLDVRPQARQRRAELVRGVRDELAARARRFLEGAEHHVEAAREAGQLVPSLDLDPLGQVSGLGHRLGRLGQPPDGCERGAGDDQSEPARDQRAPGRNQDQKPADPRQGVVGLVERPRDLDRKAGLVREGDDPDVVAADASVRVVRVALAARDAEVVPGHGQGQAFPLALAARDAVLADSLRVSAEDTRLRRAVREVEHRSALDVLHAVAQRRVDARVELVLDHEVDDGRGGDHGQRDSRRCDESEACAETHDSRSA